MNKNVLIILAGGFLIAVLVAVVVQASLSGSKKPDVDLERIQILVAAKDLSVGHEIKPGDLRWQDWGKTIAFVGAIIRDGQQQPTEAINGKLLRSLAQGQPVHMNLVVEDDRGDFLSANITKGMRAVGVSVKSYTLADRLVRPGDHVDVMVTYQVRVNSRTNPDAQAIVNRYASETVIENIRILAIDSDDTKAVDEEDDGGKKKKKKSSKSATVTLEVTPEGAEKLVLADKMGDIGIALRSLGDSVDQVGDKTTTDVSMSRVMTNLSASSGKSSGVRVYNGNEMTEVRARNLSEGGELDFSLEEEAPPAQTIIIDAQTLRQLEEEE